HKDEYGKKVFYGWFDNHLCYISSFDTFASKILNRNGNQLWNESKVYHFIGKDIVYHHYLFLPAIRFGINKKYKLPDNILTRGHLLFQNKKLSKSKNWYIGLEQFIREFDPDYLRFYFASIVPFSQVDINFDWDNFYEKINNELISKIGNFINRTLSFTQKQFKVVVPLPDDKLIEEMDEQAIKEVKQVPIDVGNLIYSNDIDKAIKKIMQFGDFLNQYFQYKQPWKSKHNSQNTIWVSVNATRCLAIMLYPFIPASAQKIWNQLGYKDNIEDVDFYSATEFVINGGHTISDNIQPIFKRLEREEIEKQKNSLL
ncbi:MAG: class I tRNA ligase family protein, partial [Thermoproteota archaeon]|nr:class I tRNA ligase family protein [Thermoproteota archaeon]